MKKFSLALIALAMALAITPAALADSFFYTFTSPNGSTVLASGHLTGTSMGGGIFDITAGDISIAGSGTGLIMGSGNILGSTGSPFTSPSGAFNYDNVVYLPPSLLPYVDNFGLLFEVGGVEVNIFSTLPFTGAGQNSYLTYEGSAGPTWNFSNNGELNIFDLTPPVPEPSSLLLLGTGLLGLALVVFRKARPSHSMTLSM